MHFLGAAGRAHDYVQPPLPKRQVCRRGPGCSPPLLFLSVREPAFSHRGDEGPSPAAQALEAPFWSTG